MTEDEARAWLDQHSGLDAEARARLTRFVALVLEESERQNLISRASRERIWSRHIVDSAQLVSLAQAHAGTIGQWIDIGSGAGFPGLVVAACLPDLPVVLVEPRPLRTAFLQGAAAALELRHVSILTGLIERVEIAPVDHRRIVSARAYAALEQIFASAEHLSASNPLWILPKGRQVQKELASAAKEWHGVFHVEQSLTDADSGIVIARDVARRSDAERNGRRHFRAFKGRSNP